MGSTSFKQKPAKVVTGYRTKVVYDKVVLPKSAEARHVFNKKRGVWYWTRKRVVYMPRYVQVPIRNRPKKTTKRYTGLDLPPHALTYKKHNSWYEVSGPVISNGEYYLTGDHWLHHKAGVKSIGANIGNWQDYGLFDHYSAAQARCEAAALGRHLAKIKDQKVNLLQALAERNQTARLLKDSVARLAKAIALMRSGRLSQAAKAFFPKNSKELSQDWLAFQYGIRPLISDIEGMAQTLATGVVGQFDVVSTATETVTSIAPRDTGSTRDYIYCDWKTTVTTTVTVRYKTRVKIKSEGMRSLAEMGFTNLPTIAWELTPWSFIVDWFLPIGKWINSLDALTGAVIQHSHKTVVIKQQALCEKSYDGTNTNGKKSSGWARYHCDRISVVRTVLTSLPAPPFPDFKDPVSAEHIANASALLRTSFKGR